MNYYDDLAVYYKLIYQDWDASVRRQAGILDKVIRSNFGESAHTILDAACGIGTQSIGLANLGYLVHASDLSSGEIKQARKEAESFNVTINFQVADMRQVWDIYQRQFDVVIACDNSVPHLLSDDEILKAFEQFYLCTKPGGGCIISVRDYSGIDRNDNNNKINPRLVHQTQDGRTILFDVWSFSGDIYELSTYITEDKGGKIVKTKVIRGGQYYCVKIPKLESLFRKAGFNEVRTLNETFFQPLIVASKR